MGFDGVDGVDGVDGWAKVRFFGEIWVRGEKKCGRKGCSLSISCFSAMWFSNNLSYLCTDYE